MYVLVIFCYNFDTGTGYDTDNDGRLERLVCRMTRYKQESAKYRKIVAVVLILLAVLAAVWLAERWYTRHKTSAAAAGVNPIGPTRRSLIQVPSAWWWPGMTVRRRTAKKRSA